MSNIKTYKSDLDERVAGSAGHATHVVLVPGHLDEASVSPAGAPAVLDEPVSLARVSIYSVADSQDAVVEVLWAALRLPVDPGVVELETLVTGVNGHTAGTLPRETH